MSFSNTFLKSHLYVEFVFLEVDNHFDGLKYWIRFKCKSLKVWKTSKDWKSVDASFVGPLESAATLGILKQFAVYKASGAS